MSFRQWFFISSKLRLFSLTHIESRRGLSFQDQDEDFEGLISVGATQRFGDRQECWRKLRRSKEAFEVVGGRRDSAAQNLWEDTAVQGQQAITKKPSSTKADRSLESLAHGRIFAQTAKQVLKHKYTPEKGYH